MPALVKHRLASLARKMAPHLLSGEAEDGPEPAHHALRDVKHDGLRRAARGARGGRRVHAVLDDVEIEAAQIDAAEVVHLLIDHVKGVLAIGLENLRLQGARAREHPAIERSEERRVGKECRSRWSPYH